MFNTELKSFVIKFHQLRNAGFTAHLDLHAHHGQCWVGLRAQLGQAGQQPPHHRHQQRPRLRRSPANARRQERRQAARQQAAAAVPASEVPAAEARANEENEGDIDNPFFSNAAALEKADEHKKKFEAYLKQKKNMIEKARNFVVTSNRKTKIVEGDKVKWVSVDLGTLYFFTN